MIPLVSAVSSMPVPYSAPLIRFDRLEEAMQMVTDYSSIHEMVDTVVDQLCWAYPELEPDSDEKTLLLKREITYFWTMTAAEKAVVILGHPAQFKYLSVAIKKAFEIGRQIRPATEDEEECRRDNETYYIMFKLCLAPLLRHLDLKKEMYEECGMSKREIEEDLGKTTLMLIDEYYKDDPNQEAIEAARERTRAKYRL